MKKIILVEDDPAIIDIYTTVFKGADFDLEVISSGQEAIRRIKKNDEESKKPDLVLLDLILPDVNGREVLKEIKTDDNTKNIPVFILSNDTNADWGQQAIKPDDFIVKANITPTQLLQVVKEKLK